MSASRIPGLKNSRWAQWLAVAGVALAAYGLLYLVLATKSDGPVKPKAVGETITTHVQSPGDQVDPRVVWLGQAGNKISNLETRAAQQENSTRAILDKFTALEQHQRDREAAQAAAAEKEKAERAERDKRESDKKPLPQSLPPPLARPAGASLAPPDAPGPTGMPPPLGRPATSPVAIGRLHVGGTPPAAAGHAVAGATSAVPATPLSAGPRSARQASTTYLPLGFGTARILGGASVSTGGQAQNDPVPVFLRIEEPAILANQLRANLTDCLLVAAAWGNLADERAYMRLQRLSCNTADGRVLEARAKGVIYGEDGKLGVAGRINSKQDKLLLNALMAGVLSGLGRGIELRTTTTTVTPVGNAVTQPQGGENVRSGIASGVGNALDRMANYYIRLAEQTFPTVLVDSDRLVQFAFTQGVELDVPLPGDLPALRADED